MNKSSANPNQEAGVTEKPEGTLIGKRYRCEKCGTEVLCTKAGLGQLWCCGEIDEVERGETVTLVGLRGDENVIWFGGASWRIRRQN